MGQPTGYAITVPKKISMIIEMIPLLAKYAMIGSG